MGKIQELHALLDAAVSESDVAPAIRLAQNETNRVAAEAVSSLAETEVLEISRLLIRLGIASVALKGAVVAGRAYGDLLGKCAARVPALGNFYSDFGCTVVCLLQAFAEGGPAVWASASLEFNHAMLGDKPFCLPITGKRQALSLFVVWASALTVFSRINHAESLNGKGVNLHQFLQPVAVVLDAIYRVIHRLDVPATVFTFLCTTLSVFIEENLVLDCNNAVKTLYAWIGSSLDRILVQDTAASPFTAQMMSDTVKTNSSILSTMEKISLANSRSSISVDKNISILVQNLLERYIAPIGPGLAGQQNTKDGMPSARTAVASIATTLLQILWRCVERSPVCDLEITTLLRCGFSPETEHYVHMIVQLTLRKDVDNIDDKYDLIEKSALQIRAITFNRLNEWVNISIREIGLAERAMKDWVLKHSSWKCGNETTKFGHFDDSEQQNSVGSCDVSDVYQLQTLLAWENDERNSCGVDLADSSCNSCGVDSGREKRRRLNPSPVPGVSLMDIDTNANDCSFSSSCYNLGGVLLAESDNECRRDEAMGNARRDFCGICAYFRSAVVDMLRTTEDCEQIYATPEADISSTQICRIQQFLSTANLVLCMAITVGNNRHATIDSAFINRIECLKSLLFYLFAVSVQVALHASRIFGVAHCDIVDHNLRHNLLVSVANCSFRLKVALHGANTEIVPKSHELVLLANVISFCLESKVVVESASGIGINNIFLHQEFGNSWACAIGNNISVELLLHLAAKCVMSENEQLTTRFWSDKSELKHAHINIRSPFPLFEIIWAQLEPKYRLQGICLAIQSLPAVPIPPKYNYDIRGGNQAFKGSGLCAGTVDTPLEDDSQGLKYSLIIAVHRDDCQIAAAVWLFRAVISLISLSDHTEDSPVISHMFSLISDLICRTMHIIVNSIPNFVLDTIHNCGRFCSLLNDVSGSLSGLLSLFHLCDTICTCNLPKGVSSSDVQLSELRRRALVSDILPAIGTLWISSEPLVKRFISELSAQLKLSDTQSKMSGKVERIISYIKFVSTSRTLFGLIHCFHINRNVELQSSSRRVLSSMDQIIKECVVTAVPSHAVTDAVSTALSVALLCHGIEDPTACLSAVSGEVIQNESTFLPVFGRMLANASSKAANVSDADDYPAGEEGRHSLLRVLLPAMTHVVKFGSIIIPEVSFWALHQLTKAWMDHPSSWHWAYQVFFEAFMRLGRYGGAHRNEDSCVLTQLLMMDPKLAAKDFFLPLIQSDSTLLSEIIENIVGIRPMHQLLGIFMPQIVSSVVLAGDLVAYRVLVSNYPAFIFRYDDAKADYDMSLSSLLETTPLILYNILMCDDLQQYDDIQIVMNYLPQRLMKSIRALKLSKDFDIRTDKPTGGRALQRYLLHAIWDNGATSFDTDTNVDQVSSIHQRAAKALRVISAIYTTDSWVGGAIDEDSSNNPWLKYATVPSPSRGRKASSDIISVRKAALNEFTADLVPSHFLYIMSHLIQKNWWSQSDHRKEHAVNTVISLVKLVRRDTISKFLPKIIAAIDAALCSKSARVRAAGATLTYEICSVLPGESLCGSISALVIGLFPILESFSSTGVIHRTLAVSETSAELNYADIRGCFLYSSADQFQASCLVDPKLSKVVGLLAEQSFHCSVEDSFIKKSFDLAVETLNSIFLPNRPDIEQLFNAVPYIPDVPGLAVVKERHSRFMELSSFDLSIRNLCSMLKHESSQVRVVVLRKLLSLIKERRRNIFSGDIATGSKSESVLSLLVTNLLTLCSRETDHAAKDVCAQCLGELGAVDPAHVSIKLTHSTCMSSIACKVILNNDGGGESGEDILVSNPPWNYNVWSLGLFLLYDHLIPALRAANGAGDVTAQDFSGIAIQEILRILADSLLTTSENSINSDFASSNGPNSQNMPEKLINALNDLQILDITEPFWSTKYNLGFAKRVYKPNLYLTSTTFSFWISSWCLQLISCSKSKFEPLYRACRGAVRHRPELSQFLLPYLIIDAVRSTESNASIYSEIVAEVTGTLSMLLMVGEINNVKKNIEHARPTGFPSVEMLLKATGLKKNRMPTTEYDVVMSISCKQLAIQGIFGLMDQFSGWSQVKSAGSHRKSKVATHDEDLLNSESSRRIVLKLCGDVPNDLLGKAALSIKAYARSARYFEISAREKYLSDRSIILAEVNRVENEKTESLLMKPPLTVPGKSKTVKSRSADESVSKSENAVSSDKYLFLHQSKRRARDGANGELPYLSEELLDNLLTIYAHLDDSDVMCGIQILRHNFDIQSNHWNRIVELEQMDQWIEALREYDLVQQLVPTISLVDANRIKVGREKELAYNVDYPAEDCSEETQDTYNGCSNSENDVLAGGRAAAPAQRVGEPLNDTLDESVEGYLRYVDETLTEIPRMDRFDVLNFVERGKLRCLMEMGHTKLAFDEWRGLAIWEPTVARSLFALGVEATWKLQEWGQLESMFTPQRDESKLFSTTMACGNSGNPTVSDDFTIDDAFLISSGKLFASFKQLESSKFLNTLADARQRVMSFLSAASRESYSRCYPALVQLHVLQEVQQAYEVHSGLFAKNKENSDHYIRNHFDWDRRFSLLSPSFKQRSKILEARRASLGIMGLRNLAAENWMMSCRALRQMGRFDTAMIALRHAEANGIGREEALLEECLLIKDTGNIRKALMLVEPDEGFLNSLRMSSIGGSNVTACVPTMSDEEINILANRLLLSTRWMHESKLAHGREIVDRFKVVLYLHKEWEDALFYLAKYNDELFESGFNDKLRTQFPAEEDRTVLIFAVTALEYYGKCMKIGSKFILQAAPKFLSVYFSIMALRGARSGSRTSSEGSALAQAQRAASDRAIKFMTEVSASKWYTCMPQIVSRAGHPSPDALKFVKGVLHNILISFPEQGIWHISCLLHSLNKERATVGRNLIRDASASLEKKRRFQSSSMLQESILLFSNLVELAHNQTKDRRIRWSIGTECQLTHFLVPSQSALTIVFPSAEELENGHGTYFPSQQEYFQSFDCSVEVMLTKAKPKKISAVTTNGRSIRFLLKQEKSGDLRKDARLMEFNTVVNRLLQEESESRKRNLRLRTFSVVCLNEECGIMEWVPHTAGLRTLIIEAHSSCLDQYPYLDVRKIKDMVEDIQVKFAESNIEELLSEYKRIVLSSYRPCFHKWFLLRYTDPTEWLEARDRFTRSSAVWSSVGHVVGLGDRHGDNIMLDVQLGECVHVDFDCLFDKGLKLQRPEIVPFRLSPSMVDAMGIFGYEGIFRRTMEVCIALLRNHKDTLIGVLEPFIRDPTVAWGRGGRAQQRDSSLTPAISGINFQDTENKDAEDALKIISERLSGVYNIPNPKASKIIKACRSEGRSIPKLGLAASQEDAMNLPLSVEGQVDRLIAEATAEINLAQMYFGWMPWS